MESMTFVFLLLFAVYVLFDFKIFDHVKGENKKPLEHFFVLSRFLREHHLGKSRARPPKSHKRVHWVSISQTMSKFYKSISI